jgi:hypothetical protein
MYTLMGIGALVLAATQPMLAWPLLRHPDEARPAACRLAVPIGLVLTFVFDAGIGVLLSSLQPPDAASRRERAAAASPQKSPGAPAALCRSDRSIAF